MSSFPDEVKRKRADKAMLLKITGSVNWMNVEGIGKCVLKCFFHLSFHLALFHFLPLPVSCILIWKSPKYHWNKIGTTLPSFHTDISTAVRINTDFKNLLGETIFIWAACYVGERNFHSTKYRRSGNLKMTADCDTAQQPLTFSAVTAGHGYQNSDSRNRAPTCLHVVED